MSAWSLNVVVLLLTLSRVILGVILFSSSIGKIRNPDYFIRAVSNYHILPAQLVRPFALLLPWFEFLVGLLLFFGFHTRIAAMMSGGLFLIFFLALEINLARGHLNIDCGCFGAGHREKINNSLLFRDLFLLALSLFVSIGGSGTLTLDSQFPFLAQFLNITWLRDNLLPIIIIVVGGDLLINLTKRFLGLLKLTLQIEDRS